MNSYPFPFAAHHAYGFRAALERRQTLAEMVAELLADPRGCFVGMSAEKWQAVFDGHAEGLTHIIV